MALAIIALAIATCSMAAITTTVAIAILVLLLKLMQRSTSCSHDDVEDATGLCPNTAMRSIECPFLYTVIIIFSPTDL